ncbi:serine/threonine protein kinase [Hymenobacter gummosus]|uniref:Serine/threonine protein kinase n=1 Tax=Hymenobacter gummosus TaxID=1776032 RepID=A0A3S0H173_9BACT|nr:serine/threonine protein kinase [Hymenobacter gummosus]RTQ45464.1 serine/threonine protein kinase [Hymenobacter gummosus]
MAEIITPAHYDGAMQAGEERLLRYLAEQLPANYLLIPNLHLIHRNSRNGAVDQLEYDLIVVAPHALYHLENKDWAGHLTGDDHTWTINGRDRVNPLRSVRFKTQVLVSQLKERNEAWGRAWVESALVLSHPSMVSRQLTGAVAERAFSLDRGLTYYLQDHAQARATQPDKITDLQRPVAEFLAGRVGPAAAPAPRLFEDEYEIDEELSRSEECTEYLVRPRGLDTPVRKRVRAYSIALAGLSPTDRELRLNVIRNQYQALQKIGAAPHLLPVVLLSDAERGELYEISDYLDASTLRAELGRRTYSLPEKLVLLRQVAQGLQAAHAAQVYHRDVRPDNIFLTPAGAALLGNFSRAFFWSARRNEFTVLPRATEDDEVALRYRAPELDDEVAETTAATDIYSLGLTIAEALTGTCPLPQSWHDLDHWGGRLPAAELPGAKVPGIPAWLDQLVADMVRLEPTDRLPDMAAVLQRFDQGLATTTKPATPNASARPAPAAETTIGPGTRLGGSYDVVAPLGDGGYARVWRVHHTLQSQDMALKLYNESVGASTLRDEFRALINLDHPNIVKFKWNEQLPDGRYYTIMELLDGPTLREYVSGEARLPMPQVYQLAREMGQALHYLHTQPRPIIHRDIKPNNILWHQGQRFVLIDFNVATDQAADRHHVGTSPYIAPDRNHQVTVDWDASCDTFALGVTLYELVCRQHPWADGRGSRIPTVSRAPRPPQELRPDLSPAFAAWLERAVQPRRAERFATAAEMLTALEAIGVSGLLRSRAVAAPAEFTTEQFVVELNRLFSQSRYTNAGTRADARGLGQFARDTYVPTRLDDKLLDDILAAKYRLVIITGNAGDGKTAFIQKLESRAEEMSTPGFRRHASRNGAEFTLQGIPFQSNYDGSQDEGDKANTQVLDEFLAPFANLADFSQAPEGRLIAINEGRLIEYLHARRAQFGALETAVEAYFYQEGVSELPPGLLLVNLNLRSVVSLSELTGEESIFRRQVQAFVRPEHWAGCHTCAVREQCFIRYNAQSLNDPDAGPEVLRRMERLLLTVHLRRELHITMRDLRSLLAFWLTRDHTCADVAELVAAGEAWPILRNYYFNISDSHAQDAGQQDRLVRLLRRTDVGQRALPAYDRALYYNPLEPRDYLRFSEQREGTLLPWLAQERDALRAQADEAASGAQREMHRLLARHQYFEGTFDSDLRLPYRAVGEFARVLLAQPADQQQELDKLRVSIAQALALLEGFPDGHIGEQYLVLAVGEKDPQAQTYRLFELEEFALRLAVPPRRTEYLEYFPDRFVFQHRQYPQVRMDISLDLFELLVYIKDGYKPSLNDLKGRSQELQLFKNLLANLDYRQVLVTSNHRDYHTIEATPQHKIIVRPKQFAR